MVVASRLVGGGVRDHNCGGLAITESDGSSLGGVRAGTRTRVGAGARGRLRRHSSVHGLGDGDVRCSRGAVGGFGNVHSRGRRASAFDGRDGSVLSGRDWSVLSGLSRDDRADWLAWAWDSGHAVNFGRGVGGQDMSRGQRGAIVGRTTLCEDWRAAWNELGQGLGDREGASRVDDRSCVAWDVSGRGLCRFTAVLA